MKYLLISIFILIVIIVLQMLKANALLLKVRKSKEVLSIKNTYDKNYQFIKGLF
jgi:hypothetical protein